MPFRLEHLPGRGFAIDRRTSASPTEPPRRLRSAEPLIRSVADYPEQSLLVEAAVIHPKRFGGANERRDLRMGVNEDLECRVGVNVIDQHDAARCQSRPCGLELERDIAFRVHAVVNENVDRLKLVHEPGKTPPAGACNVVPPTAKTVFIDCYTDLLARLRIEGRQVDAPETAGPVSFEASKMNRDVTPCATPVSTTARGREWRMTRQMARTKPASPSFHSWKLNGPTFMPRERSEAMTSSHNCQNSVALSFSSPSRFWSPVSHVGSGW